MGIRLVLIFFFDFRNMVNVDYAWSLRRWDLSDENVGLTLSREI